MSGQLARVLSAALRARRPCMCTRPSARLCDGSGTRGALRALSSSAGESSWGDPLTQAPHPLPKRASRGGQSTVKITTYLQQDDCARPHEYLASLPDRVAADVENPPTDGSGHDQERPVAMGRGGASAVVAMPRLHWKEAPRVVLLVWANRTSKHLPYARGVVEFLQHDLGLTVLTDEGLADLLGTEPYNMADSDELSRVVDFAVTLARYDARAHLSHLFHERVPPVLSIKTSHMNWAMQALEDSHDNPHADSIRDQLEQVVEGGFSLFNRLRLKCEIHFADPAPGAPDRLEASVIHDVVVHRAPYGTPTVTKISIDAMHFTTVVADGLIVTTPTGSSGYARSAGGTVLHPTLRCYQLVPVNSTSLSFRPIVLPHESHLGFRWGNLRAADRQLMLVLDGHSVPISSRDAVNLSRAQFSYPSVRVNRELSKWSDHLHPDE